MSKTDRFISHIRKTLAEYENTVNECVTANKSHTDYLNGLRGIYAESYITNKKNEYNTKLREDIAVKREKAKAVIDHDVECIKAEADRFFSGSVNKSLSDKISTIINTGIQISPKEFEVLSKEAKGYWDLKALNQLAINNDTTKGSTAAEIILNEATKNKMIDFAKIDIEGAYSAIDNMRGSLMNALNYYSGPGNELKDALFEIPKSGTRPITESINITNASSGIKGRAIDDFMETVKPVYAVLPESKRNLPLTDSERNLIDRLVDPKYPNLAEKTIRTICTESPEMIDIFAKDSRYQDIADNIDTAC